IHERKRTFTTDMGTRAEYPEGRLGVPVYQTEEETTREPQNGSKSAQTGTWERKQPNAGKVT
ncbi:hypothetical protein BaRGS_00030644, partial [Batillaria attramentaria]